MHGVFRVVFVCTGNRARSPLAEALFRRYAGAPTDVSSVGTLDVGPLPALPDAVRAGRRLDVDLAHHRARALSSVDLSSADLVLGFEPSHVEAAVRTAGADPARAFLLAELAMLVHENDSSEDPVSRAKAAVTEAGAWRTKDTPVSDALVVRDPLGQGKTFMDRTAAAIDELVRRVVLGLFGSTSS